MNLFWKTYTAVFVSFVIVVSLVSYVISIQQISEAENYILEKNRILSDFVAKEIEKDYLKGIWPLESLNNLSNGKDFLFWWVVRDEGTIHLADKAAFMGTDAHDYFPHVEKVQVKERVLLNRDENYGIFLHPLRMGKKYWSLWLGFSLRDVSEMKRKIILLQVAITITALLMLGVMLYFIIKRFTDPIKDLSAGAAILGSGALNHRVRVESEDELAQLARSFNSMAENLQRTTVSKEYLDNIIKSMRDPLVVIDPNGKISRVNNATIELLGHDEAELIGKPFESIIDNTEETPIKGALIEKLRTGTDVEAYEMRYKSKSGDKIPMLFSSSAMKDGNNAIVCIVTTAKDITDLKRVEERLSGALREKEVLLREIHHRVKNNMQVISSLLNLQHARMKGARIKAAFQESRNRVKAMALIHESLYLSDTLAEIDLNEYLTRLTRSLFRAYGARGQGISLKVAARGVSLGIEEGVCCGLIINELMSNALKHAFPEGGRGEIEITARLVGQDEVELRVSDNGVGMPKGIDARTTETLGLSLTRGLVKDQLRGTLDLSCNRGTRFTIKFKQKSYEKRT